MLISLVNDLNFGCTTVPVQMTSQHISDEDLERYYLEMVADESELGQAPLTSTAHSHGAPASLPCARNRAREAPLVLFYAARERAAPARRPVGSRLPRRGALLAARRRRRAGAEHAAAAKSERPRGAARAPDSRAPRVAFGCPLLPGGLWQNGDTTSAHQKIGRLQPKDRLSSWRRKLE